MRVIGIMLVRDEDLYVATALRNAIEFCDQLFVVDNLSKDRTPEILGSLVAEFGPKLEVFRSENTSVSHQLIESYANSDTWIFGVDGDEIYDPAGLARLRVRMESGEFCKQWALFGNVFNIRSFHEGTRRADGYLAPPCRSMTKLYNFAAIKSWTGPCVERLHGGSIEFLPGFDASMRYGLHEREPWDSTDFRCLHLCFLRRSSLDSERAGPRRNIMDRHAFSLQKILRRALAKVRGIAPVDWKQEKYARGPMVTLETAEFFQRL